MLSKRDVSFAESLDDELDTADGLHPTATKTALATKKMAYDFMACL
jgi:hypothetical protein